MAQPWRARDLRPIASNTLNIVASVLKPNPPRAQENHKSLETLNPKPAMLPKDRPHKAFAWIWTEPSSSPLAALRLSCWVFIFGAWAFGFITLQGLGLRV